MPLVVSAHGTLPYDTGQGSIKRLWDRLFAPRLLPRFDRVIALTAAEAEDARAVWSRWGANLPDARISVVPNGVHLDDFAALPPGEPFRARWALGDGPIVLFLARLHERKGAQFLIPAFAQARDAAPDARLVIAGPDVGSSACGRPRPRDHCVPATRRWSAAHSYPGTAQPLPVGRVAGRTVVGVGPVGLEPTTYGLKVRSSNH